MQNAEFSDEPRSEKIPGFASDVHGKPVIDLDAGSLYAFGHLIRSAETLVLDQFSKGLVSGTTHTCLGQELCQMAVVRSLRHHRDAVLSTHRNHGHFLTYSGEFLGLVAEIMGRKDGVCGGHGGSQHLAYRHFHSNGVQGGMAGIGVGLGLSRKRDGDGAIVAVIVGDGTLGQGLLYESINLASVWELPVLFVIENNGIAQTTSTAETTGGTIEARGKAFGLPTWRFSDDHPDFCKQVEEVTHTVRGSGGPGFLVLDTMRMGPHSKGDDLRDDAEKEAMRRRDPLARLGDGLTQDLRGEIERRNEQFMKALAERAEASPKAEFEEPPLHIFKKTRVTQKAGPVRGDPAGKGNVRQSLNSALRQLLEHSDKTLLQGEDLHDPYGGAFKVTVGLSSDFPGRVISTPISEAGITGTAIGLAMAGFRPIVEIMFADFLTLCTDQIYNHAVKFPGVFADIDVPLVIRTPSGGRRGYGPTHSQSPENLFASVPGLTVVYGSHRHNVGQLLMDATMQWPYPVLFLEHKLLYGEVQDRGEFKILPPDEKDIAGDLFPTLVRGSAEPDITIVTYGGMLPVVETVAEQLEQREEVSVEVVAPALLSPFPRRTLNRHLLARPRIAVVEEAHHDFGISAEILASLLEAQYKGRAIRIGTPPVPISSARTLESQILPDEDRLIDQILTLFD